VSVGDKDRSVSLWQHDYGMDETDAGIESPTL